MTSEAGSGRGVPSGQKAVAAGRSHSAPHHSASIQSMWGFITHPLFELLFYNSPLPFRLSVFSLCCARFGQLATTLA